MPTNEDVRYHFDMRSPESAFEVESVTLLEALNEIPEASIDLLVVGTPPVLRDLLAKKCELTISRGDELRHFRGVIYTASQRVDGERTSFSLNVAPSLGVLRQNRDSRIFQNQTVPKIIRELLEERGRGTLIDDQLERNYPAHEYVVQYGESDWQFMSRLMQEEGICCTFDHKQDDPTLVLFDKAANRPSVLQSESGKVPFMQPGRFDAGSETVTYASYHEQVGTTDLELRDYDWTHPNLAVRATRQSQAGHLQGVEIYDAHQPQRAHSYRGEQYTGHTVEPQGDNLRDRLEVRRQSWSIRGSMVSAQPGHWFELIGHPEGLDGRYLILDVQGGGNATAGESGSYSQSLSVVPLDLPYRPPRNIPRPVALPVTAKVVGPPGEEIHTDEHGRVKVQFHWDREGQSNERSSCWIRVVQSWSGPGWGSWILPRINMEVLVTFLEGDPDRPLVTGCVYNGENRTPYPLPREKTKSTLKSNSSPGGNGFNELRFEDKKGAEEIYIHAQKDFNEKVLNNHNTQVDNCQTNTVDVDQTELVKRDQFLTVDHDRAKTVKHDETTKVGEDRTESVGRDEKVTIGNDRVHHIENDDKLVVDKEQSTDIGRGQRIVVRSNSRQTTIHPSDITSVEDTSRTTVGRQWLAQCEDSAVKIDAPTVQAKSPVSIDFDSGDGDAVFNLIGAGGLANMECATQITLKVGESVISISASEIRISAPTVHIDGPNQVLINNS